MALAQVLAREPKLLLMDEPFAALDAIVRARVSQDVVRTGRIASASAVLLVTHDLEEALALSDLVYLLSQGPRARIIGVLLRADRAAARADAGPHASVPSRRSTKSSGAISRREVGRRSRRHEARAWLRQCRRLSRFRRSLWEAAGRAGLLNPLYCPAPSMDRRALSSCSPRARSGRISKRPSAAALGGLVAGLVIGTALGVAAALVPLRGRAARAGHDPAQCHSAGDPGAAVRHLARHRPRLEGRAGLHPGGGADLLHRLHRHPPGRPAPGRAHRDAGRGTDGADPRSLSAVGARLDSGNLKVAVGFAFTGAVVGEFVAASRGLGLSPFLRAEHLQRGADAGAGHGDHGCRAADFRARRWLERRLLQWRE